ncbi:Nickel transporter NixA [Actinosynnema sp. ALI-1.44]
MGNAVRGKPRVGVLSRLDSRDRARLSGMAAFVVALHVVGFGLLLLVVADGTGPAQGFGFGLGVTAYVLGMRHAFDADHIVAIDNTTRKLLEDRRRPLAVGFWFSLGHSSVVFVLCLALGLGIRALADDVADDSSALHHATGMWGALVSGLFLLMIGALNARAFAGALRVARDVRRGRFDAAEFERHLGSRGVIARLLAKLTRTVRKDWHMYPVGVLFGLGFDTATEVSLLVLSSSAAAFELPWYAFLALPLLFAAGMSLLDTADGVFMSAAYDWAMLSPARRVYYNLVVTGLSVGMALLVGAAGLLGLLAEVLGATTGVLAWFAGLDLEHVGYAAVALFIATWVASALVWRVFRIEERWRVG